jgi:hypothetical protein
MKLCFFLLGVGAVSVFISCDRVIKIYEPANPPGQDFVKTIQNIVSPAILDSLKKNGQTINDGQKPPNIESIYILSKSLLIGSNLSADQDSLNLKTFIDYKFRFYEQISNNSTIKVDEKSMDGEASATGQRGFISGNGNFFTVFIESIGTMNVNKNGNKYTVTMTQLNTYSGEIRPNGIKNFVTSFYLKNKTADPEKGVVDIGTVRVFKDKDNFSEKTNTFRLATTEHLTDSNELLLPQQFQRR